MKHKYLSLLLFICFLSVNSKAQTYNIALEPNLSMPDTIIRDQTFGTWNYMSNESTSAVDFITFSWYISSDSAFDDGDLLIDTWTTDPDDGYLSPGSNASIGTAFAKVPSSYPLSCEYYIIMKAEIDETETNYEDNFSYSKVCLRAKRIDLEATSISSNQNPYYKGINSTSAIVSGTISNEGELPASGTISYDIKLGSSPDSSVGNIYSERKSIASLEQFSSETFSETFDISALDTGTYYMFLHVDPENNISDAKKINNFIRRSFKISYQDTIAGDTILMPSGSESLYISTCDATIFDDGGKDENYSPGTKSQIYLFPAEEGKRIRIEVKDYNFDSPDYMLPYYKSCYFCGYGSMDVRNSSSLPIEFVHPTYSDQIYIEQSSTDSDELSGAEYKITCAPSYEFKPRITELSKDSYANRETIDFTFNLKNRGYSTIPSLDYSYGISTSESQDGILFESDTATSSSIDANDSVSVSDNSIDLNEINFDASETYYLFVRAGINNPDEDITDNITYTKVEIETPQVVEGGSFNMKNGENLTFTSCDMNLYDNGGPNGAYSNNFNGRAYIYPQDDKVIKLSINYDLETKLVSNGFRLKDVLSLYDAFDNEKKVTLPTGTQYNYTAKNLNGGAVMVEFISDNETREPGFNINVSCAYKGMDYINDLIGSSKRSYTLGVDKHIPFNVELSNNGTSNSIQNVNFRVYVSPTKDTADAIIVSSDLTASKSSSGGYYYYPYDMKLDISPITEAGEYYLISVIDPDDVIEEVDEENNILNSSIHVGTLPEGEVRMPQASTDTDTVTGCNILLYDYKGRNTYSSVSSIGSHLVVKPDDENQRLHLAVSEFTSNDGWTVMEIYEKEVDADNPVTTIRPGGDVFEYTTSKMGNSIEIIVNNTWSSSVNYELEAEITCESEITALNNAEESAFTISPIPVENKMTLKTSTPGIVHVYSAEGDLVATESIEKDLELDIPDWSPGVYFVKLTTSKTSTTKKIVKQ